MCLGACPPRQVRFRARDVRQQHRLGIDDLLLDPSRGRTAPGRSQSEGGVRNRYGGALLFLVLHRTSLGHSVSPIRLGIAEKAESKEVLLAHYEAYNKECADFAPKRSATIATDPTGPAAVQTPQVSRSCGCDTSNPRGVSVHAGCILLHSPRCQTWRTRPRWPARRTPWRARGREKKSRGAGSGSGRRRRTDRARNRPRTRAPAALAERR
jgi:hypothetical protein